MWMKKIIEVLNSTSFFIFPSHQLEKNPWKWHHIREIPKWKWHQYLIIIPVYDYLNTPESDIININSWLIQVILLINTHYFAYNHYLVRNQYLILITFLLNKINFYVVFLNFQSYIKTVIQIKIFALLQYTSICNNCEFEKKEGCVWEGEGVWGI